MTTTVPGLREVESAVRAVLAEMFMPRRQVERPGVAEVFAGRLLGLRQAESLRPGLNSLRVSSKTVITPLARDYLKARGVEVRWAGESEVERARDRGEWGVSIGEGFGFVDALRRGFLDGPDSWLELGSEPEDAAAWVAGSGSSGRGALVLTGESSVAVYRACRVMGVRAASASEPEAVARAVRALGMNLLVVEPAGKPLALVRQLGAAFRRDGAPRQPEWVDREALR